MATASRSWRDRARSWRLLFSTTIGKKLIMGVTGLMMVGWLFLHMAGNTLLYSGAEAMNFYGWMIQEGSHGLVWVMRVVMLGAIGLHIWAALTLSKTNSQARPEGYAKKLDYQKTDFTALTMRASGVFLLFFIILHLANLTTGHLHPAFEHLHPYENAVRLFSIEWVAAFYMVAQIPVGMHVYHGAWSGLQTLGLSHPQYDVARKRLAIAIAVLIAGVNITFPLAVLLGVIS